MTSDTKIGLLLGLIFIFVIAFVINGLPRFEQTQGPNELSYTLANYPEASPDLGAKVQKAQRYMENGYPLLHTDPTVRGQEDILGVDPAVQDQANTVVNDLQYGPILPQNPNLLQRQESHKVASWPKVWEVKDGDNLGKIAKRFYGAEKGNARASIDKIYEANRDILTSPNAVKVGQQLIIPALTPAAAKAIEEVTVPVKSVGTPEPVNTKVKPIWYTVKDGDSLCKIAAAQLGNEGRYTEIAKLNASILSDENTLSLGMRLRLPTP
jgi:nucleoid-associated protein YgaU